ncbi:aquaporin-9-like isoform X1 [Brachionus plicatilis]|uniref:Aquaporin-9-like isoform X1 n=1 Tax=Brachionus plicatilis TaxID=10195 RepID=A0A3M7SGE2_BRAPC|nr:aquaporin-9-like isoform X1 [Brachionus plicatilis]
MSTNDAISIENEHSLNSRFDRYPEAIENLNKFTKILKKFKVEKKSIKEFMAELLGTAILVFFGLCAGAQSKFIAKDDPKSSDYLSPHLAGGIGASLAIFLVGKISGAHLNPAVSFGMYLISKLKFIQLLVYILAQFLGAFMGALFVFILYYEALGNYEVERSLNTAQIFTTFPAENIGIWTTLFDQMVGTGFLVIVIIALADKKISALSHGFVALLIGLTLFVIGSTMGYNCGAPVNPARDFSPRLFVYIAGWGSQVFNNDTLYFLVPLFGPLLGSIFASITYNCEKV